GGGEMEEVGSVLEVATPLVFLFTAMIDSPIALHDYVVVETSELIDKEVKHLQILAEVIGFEARNPLATPEMALEQKSSLYSYKILRTEILGYLNGQGRIFRPKTAPNPGTLVYRADTEILKPFFKGEEKKIPLYVGQLAREPEVNVPIHLQEAQFHIGVFAATRAGKSYLAGKIIEEILEKTVFPVIVVDIHGDYVKMDQREMGEEENNFNTIVYQPPGAPKIEGLTADRRELRIGFKQVSIDALLMMLGGIGEVQRSVIEEILEDLEEKGNPYSIGDVISIVEERLKEEDEKGKPVLKSRERGSYMGLLQRLKELARFVPFTDEEVDVGSLFQPKTLSIICLSGLRESIQDSLTASIIDLIFKHQVATKDNDPQNFIPAFLFIEEAHRVASGRSRFAVETISTAIREGAKYGFFLTIISQRPRSIDPDVLSNIGNYAVLRITNAQDQHIIESASESFSHRLVEDLPALNQGEAILVGPFVPLPAHVKVLKRKTVHRGATPNLYEIMKSVEERISGWDKSWK
ncbi:MAG: ATP-binding protein, partial [Candidatus Bathyarchaeia archaeon]